MTAVSAPHLPVPAAIANLDADWLSSALGLGEVAQVSVEPIGIGNASDTARLRVRWAGTAAAPSSFVVKLSAADEDKRRAAMHWRTYEVEVNFYSRLASALRADIPRCFWAGYEPESGRSAVVLEDLGQLRAGDDVAGATAEDAQRVLAEIALVHAARWDDPALADLDWLNRYPRGQAGMLREEMTIAADRVDDLYTDALPAAERAAIRQFAERSDHYDRKGFGRPRTITHGDLRMDNVMLGPDRVCLVDWQTVQLGAALADVAYLLGSGISTEVRRINETDLVRGYHERLVAEGVDLAWDECWREYRRHGLCVLTTALKVIAQRELTGRAREVVTAIARRGITQAMDLESIDLLGS